MYGSQFEQSLMSVSYSNLVWNLALINLAKQNFQIKYGFDKVNGLDLLVSDKKIFKVFTYMCLCKTNEALDRAIFDPSAIICTILVKAY